MLQPRILRPLPATLGVDSADVQFGQAPVSVLRVGPGVYPAESLAGVLELTDRWRNCVWLRWAEPRSWLLAASLAEACLHRWPAAGQGLQADADPFARLAAVLRNAPREAAVVIEFDASPTTATRGLLRDLRPILADHGVILVAIVEHDLPVLWPNGRPKDGLATLWTAVPEPLLADLPERLLSLVGHRTAVLRDVADAAKGWPADAVTAAIERAHGWRGLSRHLTADLLDLCTPAQRAALAECVRLGYWHPELSTESVPVTRLRPWVLPLEDGWGWLRTAWRRPLQRLLKGAGSPMNRPAGPRFSRLIRQPLKPPASEPTLEVRLLGPFELRIDGRAVRKWNGQRGPQVMQFLLGRQRHACSRDELLEEFWPEVPPAAARNRLHVAISGLRRALTEVTSRQVLEYVDGQYRVSPEFDVMVDVERFEQALSQGRRAERAGDSGAALARFREAVDLYRGDFVPDAPYRQWTLLPRESLRLAYLDTLNRICGIHIARGEIDQCVGTALRMLDVDPCWEPAHRILIRCYAQQGRAYLALRQFDICRRVLRKTLGANPQPETIKLYMSVRAGPLSEPAPTD